jgi:hypothetical protein
LFHPIFGHFLDDLLANSLVPAAVSRATVHYIRVALAIYKNEKIRKVDIDKHLVKILGIATSNVVNSDQTTPDATVLIPPTGDILETVVALLREDKNEFGNRGCDP